MPKQVRVVKTSGPIARSTGSRPTHVVKVPGSISRKDPKIVRVLDRMATILAKSRAALNEDRRRTGAIIEADRQERAKVRSKHKVD